MLQATRNFIAKLRELPQNERLVIFFLVMALVIAVGGYLAFRSTMSAIPKFSESLSGIKVSPADVSGGTSSQDTSTHQMRTIDNLSK